MDYTKYTAIKKSFSKNPNLCDLFKLLAIETWKRIEYAYLKPGVKIYETTLTQNIIFSINAYNDEYNLNIEIFESDNERVNGNDLELIIKYPNEGVEFYTSIQAKKLYRNNKYQSMDHGAQIESLLNYASRRNSIPLYLLYNFTTIPFTTPLPLESIGCTLIPAEHLFYNYYSQRFISKNGKIKSLWKIPNIQNLHSHFFPWHEIVCTNNPLKLFKTLQKYNIIAPSLKVKTKDELLNDNSKFGFRPINIHDNSKWRNIKDLTVSLPEQKIIAQNIGYILDTEDKNNSIVKVEREKVYPDFSPKSRVVVTQNKLI